MISVEKFSDSSDGYMSWIDTAKRLGLYLVILGHLWYYSNFPVINKAIYSFHMPLFFIMSGLVIKGTSNRVPITEYIKKHTLRLLLPSCFFVIMFLPVYFVREGRFDIIEFMKRIFFWNGLLPYNDPCWFFIVLYEVKILERVMDLASKEMRVKFITCVISFVMGFIVYQFKIFIPFGLDRGLIAFGYLVFGMLTKDVCFCKVNDRLKVVYSFFVFPVWCISGIWLNCKVSMYSFELGNYWLFILSGICGSFLFIVFCQRVDKRTARFRRNSENTIFIIGTHYICVTIFVKVTGYVGIHYTWMYSVGAIIYALVLVYCYMKFVCRFVNKYVPLLNGMRKNYL